MKIKARFIFLALFMGSVSQATQQEVLHKSLKEISPSQLEFHYEDYDGGFNYGCKSELAGADNPYDFSVKCFEKQILKRTFNVHLALTVYRKAVAPKTKVEILYWVNGEGATSWLTFDDAITLQEFESSQSLKNESSDLRMKINLRPSQSALKK